MNKNRRAKRRGQLQRRLRGQAQAQRRRPVTAPERLEQRLPLTVEMAPFQNPFWALDVNDDGSLSARDVFIGAQSLFFNGRRELVAPAVAGDPDGAEGEADGSMMYIDVNGDNTHDARDVLASVQGLLEGEGPQVEITMTARNAAGTPITSANVGDQIGLLVTIEDIRDPDDPDFPQLAGDPDNLGIFSAGFDFQHSTNVSFIDADPGADGTYTLLTTGAFVPSAGFLDEAGIIQADFGLSGPVGAGPFEMYELNFQIDDSGLDAMDDSTTTEVNTAVGFAVLGNDELFTEISFRRQPATEEIITSLGVNGANDPAVPANEVVGDSLVTLSLNTQFTNLQVVSVTPGSGMAAVDDKGTADPLDDEIVFTPATDFFGTSNIGYSVSDGAGGTDTATLVVTVNPPARPLAVADPINVIVEDSTANDITGGVFNIYANDILNPGATSVTLEAFTMPQFGTLTNPSGNQLLYTPPANFEGVDTFTYTINDDSGQGEDSTATVTITIVEDNDAVTANPDSDTTAEGVDKTILGSFLLSNDDPGAGEDATRTDGQPAQTLTITGVSPMSTAGGTVTLNGGNVIYSPPSDDFVGTDTFTYTISDNGTTAGDDDFSTDTATVTVTVTEVNDAPVPGAFSIQTSEGSPAAPFSTSTLTGLASPGGGTDEDNQTISFVSVSSTSAAGGTVSLLNGQITYTPPDAFFNGSDSFTYVIEDDGTTNGNPAAEQATGTVNVTVTEINNAPTADEDLVDGIKDAPVVIPVTDLLNGDTAGPANESDQTLTVIDVDTTTTGATVTLDDRGTADPLDDLITYTPPSGFVGEDTFTYTIEDDGTTDGDDNFMTAVGTVRVNVRDFIPSVLSGFSYLDVDFDGVKDGSEDPLAGVTIILEGPDGTQTTTTDANGFYEFTNLAPGSYTIRQVQPMFLVNSQETIGSQGDPANLNSNANDNQILVSITGQGGVTGTDNNFGEFGIQAGFLSILDLRSGPFPEVGVLTGTTMGGEQYWQSMLGGWQNAVEIETHIGPAMQSVMVRVRDSNDDWHERTFSLATERRIRLMGSDPSLGYIVRIEGSAADLGFTDLAAAQSPEAAEVEGEANAAASLGEAIEQLELLAFGLDQFTPSDEAEVLSPDAVDAALAEFA